MCANSQLRHNSTYFIRKIFMVLKMKFQKLVVYIVQYNTKYQTFTFFTPINFYFNESILSSTLTVNPVTLQK